MTLFILAKIYTELDITFDVVGIFETKKPVSICYVKALIALTIFYGAIA